MRGRFFDSESMVWKPFGWIGDIVFLSLLWFICSVPIITMGAATTALYDAVAHGFCQKEPETILRFLRTLKKEFKIATLSTIIWGVILGALFALLRAFGNNVAANDTNYVITVAGLAILMMVVGVVSWVFPLLSRFTFDVKGLNITAVKLAMGQLPSTLCLGFITVLCGYVCVRFWVPFFFMPALMALAWTVLTERVFRRYEQTEDEEENMEE